MAGSNSELSLKELTEINISLMDEVMSLKSQLSAENSQKDFMIQQEQQIVDLHDQIEELELMLKQQKCMIEEKDEKIMTQEQEIRMQIRLKEEASRSSRLQQEKQQAEESQQEQQEEPQPLQRPIVFTPTMPHIYADTTFLSTEERKEIKFDMISTKLSCLEFNEAKPAIFLEFSREGERFGDDNMVTSLTLGTFTTPISGRYRFDIKWYMAGVGKANWYLCCVRKEYFMRSSTESGKKGDDGKDDDTANSLKTKYELEEKERVFKKETTRNFLFTADTKDMVDGKETVGDVSLGIEDCDNDVVFWPEVVILEGKLKNCVCKFSGRLVC